MSTDRLELSPTCRFEVSRAEGYPPDVTLEYVEHACDHFSSDVHTSMAISEDEALEVVAFLARAFGWSGA